ncbi:MAG: hypothetical protein GXY34_09935 [Syntrophomonadaceae bacterium]|nr:hypothetical protein [Syntrophomonadaceae bacterium]
MQRFYDLQIFYELLLLLDDKLGKHFLIECNQRMDWPRHGISFFFEQGELRDNGIELRVVRIGVSNPSKDKKSGLWDRLCQKRGSIKGQNAGGGNHRISDFRAHIGSALLHRDNIDCDTWDASFSNAIVRRQEYPLEIEVSDVIAAMPFLWLSTDYARNPLVTSQMIRNNCIALLSNYDRKPHDKASANWLGNYCGNRMVRQSGLWHSEHVSDRYDPLFLNTMSKLVKKM